jgi:PAS domain S-box-containing protein
MNGGASVASKKIVPEELRDFIKEHQKGACVSSIASVSIWAFGVITYLLGIFKGHHLVGISASVLYLVVINVATLIILKRFNGAKRSKNFSLFIILLQISGYTAIIYFCGGIEVPHITLIYAALIAYIGVATPKSHSFIVASFCAANYFLMFALIHLGFIPHLRVFQNFSYPPASQPLIILEVVGFLYAVAFASATSANLIKRNKKKLKQQYAELVEVNEKLVHEIELRIQAVDALQESEQQYRSILEFAPDAITMIRIDDGRYVQVNECFLEMTGYSRQEAIGRSPVDLKIFVNPKDWVELLEILREKGKIKDLDVKLRRRNDKIIDVLLSASILRYRGEDCLITVITDITNRKKAERAVRESERRYKTLTNNLNVGVYRNTIGPHGKFIEANPAILKMFAYQNRDEFLSIKVADLYQKPNDREIFTQKMLKNGFVRNEELNLKRKDGTPLKGSVSSVVVKDEHGKAIYYDGIIEDVSERKRLETQLQQAHKMEAIGTLAGGIAHDFNNLLMAMQGNVSLMMYDLDSNSRHYQYLMNIETSINSGAKLTKQLLGYARKGKYQIRPLNLNKLVRQTLDTFGRTRKDITIHYELSKGLPAISADEGQMEQLLLNLYVNAADAMPAGGEFFLRTNSVAHDDMKNKFFNSMKSNYVQLTITDTGIGMDKSTQERIFEPFFTTKEMGRGTGLGLASVFGIIKSHSGYIDVESKLGHGTTFKVYLPTSDQKATRAIESSGHIRGGNGTILLVDDEKLVLDAGSKILDRLGYTVLEATGGEEALEIYENKKNKIDMVILDMIMPGMGGGEVYDRMRLLNPNVKVLLSSGYSIDGQATEILKRGCEDFIQKPFSVRALSEIVSKFLY